MSAEINREMAIENSMDGYEKIDQYNPATIKGVIRIIITMYLNS
jgi:hypothetical protein